MAGRRAILQAALAAFTLAVFAVDLLTPQGIEVWVLYLPVILAPVWQGNARRVLLASAACSGLVLGGLFLSHPGGNPAWWDLVNRGMGLMAIGLTAFAGVVLCRRSARLAEVRANLEREVANHLRTEQSLRESEERLRLDLARREELEREVVQITTREQRRIGQELHDAVGQELTGLGLMAGALAHRLPDLDEARRIAARLLAGLDRVHQEVRTLSRGLIPVQVEAEALSAALADLAARVSVESGLPVTLDHGGGPDRLDQETATQLFRIAQEAVSNALRHGRPRRIHLALASGPDGLRLSVHDDGAGLPDRPGPNKGMGLRIMHYRAEQIGGVLRVGPDPAGGTVVLCTLQRSVSDGGEEPEAGPGAGEDPDRR